MSKKINEATGTDVPIILKLINQYGWEEGKTLFYQQQYALNDSQQQEFNKASIKPDIVLSAPDGTILAVIENNAGQTYKDLLKLRTVINQVLKPRFLYACSADKILFYDTTWRNKEFVAVDKFMTLAEMQAIISQTPAVIAQSITITEKIGQKTLRYYQRECVQTIIDNYQAGKSKMLIHMATGLGKTFTMVVLVKALLDSNICKKVLFVVDRRMLAQQAIDDGFSLIKDKYSSSWINSSNFAANKQSIIHIVVIDTLENMYTAISPNMYDLLIVDECHRSININRKLIFDHFQCPRVGLTATPRISKAKAGASIAEEDLAILDTYRLFGCETGEPDYQFDMKRGIEEKFLAGYKPVELLTYLAKEASESGITVQQVTESDSQQIIQLTTEKILNIEQFNRKYISTENCMRIAEQLKANSQRYEKMIVFGVSQAHCMELTKAINKVFNENDTDGWRYAESVISENNEKANELLKARFKKHNQKPYILTSVDILSTGVDIPCVRYIAFAALTQSVGKYIQMLGRGTRLDEKTGKYSFTVLDFVGLCRAMEDNGKGTNKPNIKIATDLEFENNNSAGSQPKGRYFLIDNPDPANFIQRQEIHGDKITVIDNLPLEKARQIFEDELKNSQAPIIVSLKSRQADYQPSNEEIEQLLNWLQSPNTYLEESHLQRIYNFPEGSIWDFLLHALNKKTLPTLKERLEINYQSFLDAYDFSEAQLKILNLLKSVIVSNAAIKKEFTIQTIFGNPMYKNLLGSPTQVNQIFDGVFDLVFDNLLIAFNLKTAA